MLAPLKLNNHTVSFEKPLIMGVVNLTPDSFFDGGAYNQTDQALKHIETLILEGADIIDIGAESSRPGSEPISVEEEIDRLKGVLEVFQDHFNIPLSLDTTKADVAEFGLESGVDIINDISGLRSEENMALVIAKFQAAAIAMHKQGAPKTMQNRPTYHDVIEEIDAWIGETIEIAQAAGVMNLMIDPGIGFGKTVEHNVSILKHLSNFKKWEYPIVIGTSNKSFIGGLTGAEADQRLPGTIASNLWAYQQGAHIFRVHQVKELKQALHIVSAIEEAD